MNVWRWSVWICGGILMLPLLMMAFRLPYFIGLFLFGMALWRGSDLLRLRTARLDRAMVACDLADLLELGVPLDQAADRLSQELFSDWRTSSTSLARAWKAVAAQVANGATLGAAVGRAGKVFPSIWVAVLATAGPSERLPAALRRLAGLEMLELEMRRTQAVSPRVVGVFALGVLFFLVTYIWPTFITLYEGMEVPANPLMTGLIAGAKFLRNPAGLLPLLLVLWGLWWLLSQLRSKTGEQARLAEALAFGAELGLGVPRMLELASHACGPGYRRELRRLAQEPGDTLAQALGRRRLLPAPALWLVSQGEAHNALVPALQVTAQRLLEQERHSTVVRRQVMYQVALVGLGIFVGSVCIATMASLVELTLLISEAF